MRLRRYPSGALHPVRFIYLGYYLRQTDWQVFKKYLNAESALTGHSRLRIAARSTLDSLVHNVSLLEVFQFRLSGQSRAYKRNWAGSGYMYEYQRLMNPPLTRDVLDDKRKFYRQYGNFFQHKVYTLSQLESDDGAFAELIGSASDKIVLKASDGKCGEQVAIIDKNGLDRQRLITNMKAGAYDMSEEFINQHHDLNQLSPSAVNTVRIITQLNAMGDVEILGCRLRISVNCEVDNLAAGNLAAPIDEATGTVNGPAVYSDVSKNSETLHPMTGTPIVGFQIPYWEQCLRLAKEAARHDDRNRSIGWDIVVTDSGPGLIEGNHDWCKLVWQLPVERGLRPMLERHWSEYSERVET